MCQHSDHQKKKESFDNDVFHAPLTVLSAVDWRLDGVQIAT